MPKRNRFSYLQCGFIPWSKISVLLASPWGKKNGRAKCLIVPCHVMDLPHCMGSMWLFCGKVQALYGSSVCMHLGKVHAFCAVPCEGDFGQGEKCLDEVLHVHTQPSDLTLVYTSIFSRLILP